jgi:azurin/lysophospholipase L1-like esterase
MSEESGPSRSKTLFEERRSPTFTQDDPLALPKADPLFIMQSRFLRDFVPIVLACLATLSGGIAQKELKKGDHLVLIGNGLADRMQHHGWLEAFVQAAYPKHQLVIRNQGYHGDRVDHRPRNKGFLNADQYLTLSKADVIYAMFGYNESFDGTPDKFKAALIKWVGDTRKKNYSGKGAPRIVLFSPIAHEDLGDANLPDGKANNARLGAYTEAMAAAAKASGVGYVDLYSPSLALYAKDSDALTFNGIHLTNAGNRQLAEVIVEALSGSVPQINANRLEQLRQAVLSKNLHWFNRYRATDGNDVWGGRSHLKFTDGQTNRTVLQHELQQLDVMTANRDVVVWAAVAGKNPKPDDSNVSDDVVVKTNLAKRQMQGGVSKTGSNTYISGKDGLDKMTLEKGLKANLFASEEMFPELANPVQLGVDTKGRLWVAAWPTYPKWRPKGVMNDALLILPDENRDGVADRVIEFAKVHNPTGFEFWNGGVLVASAPNILFLKDTDGDDVADVRIRMLGGIDSADTHHTANNFVYGPGGFLYYQRGVFHVSNVETPWRKNQQSNRSAMYRFNPRTHEFSFHANNSPNPHGIAFDYWGYHYATDGTGGRAFQVKPNGKGGFQMRRLLKQTVRPVPSSTILSSAHFPAKNQGNFLICNSIAFLGIKQYTLSFDTEKGDANGTETDDLLVSKDPNFRPTDVEIGDDGALYVSDWANAIVGHMQHNVRDPSRDHKHGRIYRLTVPGRPLSKHVAIDGQPIETLLAALEHPINGIRHRARVEISERDTKLVIAATKKWLKKWDPKNKAHAHHLLEGLWVHQQHNVVDLALLQTLLKSPEPHARVAAKTVKQFWDHNDAQPGDLTVPADDGLASAKQPDADAIVIKTLPEKMEYDTKTFTVKAGQKVKIWFQNDDFMPHNLLFCQPGSGMEVAMKAVGLGAKGFDVGFVPKHKKILAASKLLNHRQIEVMEFTAPATPGNYDYVCTFPGHWTLMKGVMKVTR